MIALILKTKLFKFAFGYSFTISSIAWVEEAINTGDFFNNILNAVPSRIVVILGIVYGCSLVLDRVDKMAHNYIIRKIKRKEEEEVLEQEKIKTDRELREFEDDL